MINRENGRIKATLAVFEFATGDCGMCTLTI